jgi:hypothetical protein
MFLGIPRMPTTRDQEGQDLRIDQMAINIEKLRADMRWEARKFLISALLATAAAGGAGVAIGNFVASRPQPAQFPPGTVITIPPAKP